MLIMPHYQNLVPGTLLQAFAIATLKHLVKDANKKHNPEKQNECS